MPEKGLHEKFLWLNAPRARDPNELKRLQFNTFSWPVMDAALKIALIYPLLLLLIQWVATGQNTSIAGVTILVAEERTWLRAALVGPIVVYAVARILATASQIHIWNETSEWLYSLVILSSLFVAFKLVLITAFGIAISVIGAGSLAGAFAIVGASGIAMIVVGAGSITLAFILPYASPLMVVYGCSKGKGGWSYALFVVGLWACLVLAFAFSSLAGLKPESRVFLFVIGLLPLINAMFDYLSYGFTLSLVRYGRRQRNLLTGLIWLVDGVVAILLLIGLGFGLTGTMALINHLSGEEFIGLRQIFDDLKTPDGRAGYAWLTLCLFSTLVPTLVHLVLVFLSAFTWVPQRFKLWIARGIGDDNTGDLATLGGSAAAATLGALWAGLVVLGLWGIWMFITAYLEPVGLMILWIVEGVSLSLGWI